MSMCLWCFLDLDAFSSLRHVYTGFCIRFIVSIWRDFSYRVIYVCIYILCIHPDLTGEQRCISTRIFRYTVSESFPSFAALACTPSTSETRATAASTRSNNVTRCN